MELSEFKIHSLAEEFFTDLPYHSFNFSKHLQENITLTKDLTRETNGRPDLATYTFGGEQMLKRGFLFIDDPGSELMVFRQESVSLTLLDGSDGPWFVVKTWTANPLKPEHLVKMAEERETGRSFIINLLKLVVYNGLKMQFQTDTTAQIGVRSGEFFTFHGNDIRAFIQAGDRTLATSIMADMETEHAFLDLSSGIPGKMIRQYIADKVNF